MAVDIRTLPKVLNISDQPQPTWGSDSGRYSNSGTFHGTFKGYFTDLQINFGKTTQAEMTRIKTYLQPKGGIIKSVTYRDTDTGQDKTEDFYGTVINATYSNKNGYYQPFSVSLKAVKKR